MVADTKSHIVKGLLGCSWLFWESYDGGTVGCVGLCRAEG